MGNKTLEERVLDLEQSLSNIEEFMVFLGKKIPIYDKIIQTRKNQAKALRKARRVKAKK